MLRITFAAAVTLPLIACTPLQANRKAEEKGPVIARAVFSDKACPNDPESGRSESVLGAAAASWLVGKAAESAVNFVEQRDF